VLSRATTKFYDAVCRYVSLSLFLFLLVCMFIIIIIIVVVVVVVVILIGFTRRSGWSTVFHQPLVLATCKLLEAL
jgi:hypothetical protein